MVGLIEHAQGGHSVTAYSVLLGGAIAVMIASTAMVSLTRPDDDALRRTWTTAAWVAAAAAAVIGFLPLPAWLLAGLLSAVPMALWSYAFAVKALRHGPDAALGG